ncbi:SWIM zinc finger domain protein [Natronomonas pharaonis DSM 2160]|uniref:SWIM zinc finger domain protein n=1 Tax=Natronomonas pharaonis (strain ATCC 35678 / DSM 2160 / CIP 103997 / JCM 8858 / NBRC 14720 / NCIMB 2260 / Gabara) TaxID=348780 RepID=A0A1U7EXS3_NATPD|nr:SWIM zinc finger family protein [Natronomonas pharaonis]CAI50012.1 SWIM zinc finger domain protein [Natronomonas pharaonis DSM 2160]
MEYPTRSKIRSFCTEQSFERGVKYYEQDRIQKLEVEGGDITAIVRGSRDYDISIDIEDDTIRTVCSCPYDYAGDCKHIVAVLLAVEDRSPESTAETADSSDNSETVDVEALIDRTPDDELRTFLLDIIADDRDIRDRFVAFAGEEPGKTVYDYKQEIDRLFEDAAGRGGMIEYDTRIDFSQYHDLVEMHRSRGNIGTATDLYRALAETIRENMNRIDDSSGHYGRELSRAIEGYAETITEQGYGHPEKRPHIEYLFGEFIDADYGFASEDYAEALRTICTTRADLEYWLELLDAHVSGVDLEPGALEASVGSSTETTQDDVQEDISSSEPTDGSNAQSEDETDTTVENGRTDNVLYTSDFATGPLSTDDFTGGTLDVEHLAVGPLEIGYFVGDAFDELRVDAPTTVERHTVEIESPESSASESDLASKLQKRRVLSTYVYVLEELGEEDVLDTLYEEIYLEDKRFCKAYAERLIEQDDEERALEVVEHGIDTFRSTTDLRWLAVDLYRNREPDKYKALLKQLFLDHSEWDAYDELKEACTDREWASIYGEFERTLDQRDRQRLISMYVHEMDLEKAFFELKEAENLSWMRRYQDPVATVDPIEYFEMYREQLIPFAAGETGRRHYREIADHLESMQGLVSDARLEEFVEFLKDKHSNRPAFLDELEKAGF